MQSNLHFEISGIKVFDIWRNAEFERMADFLTPWISTLGPSMIFVHRKMSQLHQFYRDLRLYGSNSVSRVHYTPRSALQVLKQTRSGGTLGRTDC